MFRAAIAKGYVEEDNLCTVKVLEDLTVSQKKVGRATVFYASVIPYITHWIQDGEATPYQSETNLLEQTLKQTSRRP
jgi:elongation factor P hydroxylase